MLTQAGSHSDAQKASSPKWDKGFATANTAGAAEDEERKSASIAPYYFPSVAAAAAAANSARS
jgi:hypothetical protein